MTAATPLGQRALDLVMDTEDSLLDNLLSPQESGSNDRPRLGGLDMSSYTNMVSKVDQSTSSRKCLSVNFDLESDS